MTNTIVRINGIDIDNFYCKNKLINHFTDILPKSRTESNKLKKLSIFLWSVSGSLLLQSKSYAESGSLWTEMQPIWHVFQEIAMIVGAIALFVGLISFIFKRQLGKKMIVTTVVVVGGCYLVPAALMLLAIIGSMINDTLMNVFENSGLNNSVKVGG